MGDTSRPRFKGGDLALPPLEVGASRSPYGDLERLRIGDLGRSSRLGENRRAGDLGLPLKLPGLSLALKVGLRERRR